MNQTIQRKLDFNDWRDVEKLMKGKKAGTLEFFMPYILIGKEAYVPCYLQNTDKPHLIVMSKAYKLLAAYYNQPQRRCYKVIPLHTVTLALNTNTLVANYISSLELRFTGKRVYLDHVKLEVGAPKHGN